jgi:N-acetylglucosaminyldiphosphoundecaprenol N-acetyl-beta-D-mannosaminyltransferase
METVKIFGINVACLDLDGILACVRDWVELEDLKERHDVGYVNAHVLNLAWEDDTLQKLLQDADLVYADGVGAVWAGRILAGRRLEKLTGADWIDRFCDHAARHGWRLYLLGGKPGVARRAAQVLIERHPMLQVIGTADGLFEERIEADVIAEIERLAPQVLFVGMGCPRQEKWLAGHPNLAGVRVGWSVGALFDYLADVERRAPLPIRQLNLEWFWRFLVDVPGKWRRYLLGIPLFIIRVLRQKINFVQDR